MPIRGDRFRQDVLASGQTTLRRLAIICSRLNLRAGTPNDRLDIFGIEHVEYHRLGLRNDSLDCDSGFFKPTAGRREVSIWFRGLYPTIIAPFE